jgi:hypothetical protein
MSATVSPEKFQEFMDKYQTAKNNPPPDGTVLNAEPGREIHLTYDKVQDLLSCNIDIDMSKIVDSEGNPVDEFQWKFIYTDDRNKAGLRVIITGPEKVLYLQWPEHVKVCGVKINHKSRSGKAVLASLILTS